MELCLPQEKAYKTVRERQSKKMIVTGNENDEVLSINEEGNESCFPFLTESDLCEIRVQKSIWFPWPSDTWPLGMARQSVARLMAKLHCLVSQIDIVRRNQSLSESYDRRQAYRKNVMDPGVHGELLKRFDSTVVTKRPKNVNGVSGQIIRIKPDAVSDASLSTEIRNGYGDVITAECNWRHALIKGDSSRTTAHDCNLQNTVNSIGNVPNNKIYSNPTQHENDNPKTDRMKITNGSTQNGLKIPLWFTKLLDNGLKLNLDSMCPDDVCDGMDDEFKQLVSRPRSIRLQPLSLNNNVDDRVSLVVTEEIYPVTDKSFDDHGQSPAASGTSAPVGDEGRVQTHKEDLLHSRISKQMFTKGHDINTGSTRKKVKGKERNRKNASQCDENEMIRLEDRLCTGRKPQTPNTTKRNVTRWFRSRLPYRSNRVGQRMDSVTSNVQDKSQYSEKEHTVKPSTSKEDVRNEIRRAWNERNERGSTVRKRKRFVLGIRQWLRERLEIFGRSDPSHENAVQDLKDSKKNKSPCIDQAQKHINTDTKTATKEQNYLEQATYFRCKINSGLGIESPECKSGVQEEKKCKVNNATKKKTRKLDGNNNAIDKPNRVNVGKSIPMKKTPLTANRPGAFSTVDHVRVYKDCCGVEFSSSLVSGSTYVEFAGDTVYTANGDKIHAKQINKFTNEQGHYDNAPRRFVASRNRRSRVYKAVRSDDQKHHKYLLTKRTVCSEGESDLFGSDRSFGQDTKTARHIANSNSDFKKSIRMLIRDKLTSSMKEDVNIEYQTHSELRSKLPGSNSCHSNQSTKTPNTNDNKCDETNKASKVKPMALHSESHERTPKRNDVHEGWHIPSQQIISFLSQEFNSHHGKILQIISQTGSNPVDTLSNLSRHIQKCIDLYDRFFQTQDVDKDGLVGGRVIETGSHQNRNQHPSNSGGLTDSPLESPQDSSDRHVGVLESLDVNFSSKWFADYKNQSAYEGEETMFSSMPKKYTVSNEPVSGVTPSRPGSSRGQSSWRLKNVQTSPFETKTGVKENSIASSYEGTSLALLDCREKYRGVPHTVNCDPGRGLGTAWMPRTLAKKSYGQAIPEPRPYDTSGNSQNSNIVSQQPSQSPVRSRVQAPLSDLTPDRQLSVPIRKKRSNNVTFAIGSDSQQRDLPNQPLTFQQQPLTFQPQSSWSGAESQDCFPVMTHKGAYSLGCQPGPLSPKLCSAASYAYKMASSPFVGVKAKLKKSDAGSCSTGQRISRAETRQIKCRGGSRSVERPAVKYNVSFGRLSVQKSCPSIIRSEDECPSDPSQSRASSPCGTPVCAPCDGKTKRQNNSKDRRFKTNLYNEMSERLYMGKRCDEDKIVTNLKNKPIHCPLPGNLHMKMKRSHIKLLFANLDNDNNMSNAANDFDEGNGSCNQTLLLSPVVGVQCKTNRPESEDNKPSCHYSGSNKDNAGVADEEILETFINETEALSSELYNLQLSMSDDGVSNNNGNAGNSNCNALCQDDAIKNTPTGTNQCKKQSLQQYNKEQPYNWQHKKQKKQQNQSCKELNCCPGDCVTTDRNGEVVSDVNEAPASRSRDNSDLRVFKKRNSSLLISGTKHDDGLRMKNESCSNKRRNMLSHCGNRSWSTQASHSNGFWDSNWCMGSVGQTKTFLSSNENSSFLGSGSEIDSKDTSGISGVNYTSWPPPCEGLDINDTISTNTLAPCRDDDIICCSRATCSSRARRQKRRIAQNDVTSDRSLSRDSPSDSSSWDHQDSHQDNSRDNHNIISNGHHKFKCVASENETCKNRNFLTRSAPSITGPETDQDSRVISQNAKCDLERREKNDSPLRPFNCLNIQYSFHGIEEIPLDSECDSTKIYKKWRSNRIVGKVGKTTNQHGCTQNCKIIDQSSPMAADKGLSAGVPSQKRVGLLSTPGKTRRLNNRPRSVIANRTIVPKQNKMEGQGASLEASVCESKIQIQRPKNTGEGVSALVQDPNNKMNVNRVEGSTDGMPSFTQNDSTSGVVDGVKGHDSDRKPTKTSSMLHPNSCETHHVNKSESKAGEFETIYSFDREDNITAKKPRSADDTANIEPPDGVVSLKSEKQSARKIVCNNHVSANNIMSSSRKTNIVAASKPLQSFTRRTAHRQKLRDWVLGDTNSVFTTSPYDRTCREEKRPQTLTITVNHDDEKSISGMSDRLPDVNKYDIDTSRTWELNHSEARRNNKLVNGRSCKFELIKSKSGNDNENSFLEGYNKYNQQTHHHPEARPVISTAKERTCIDDEEGVEVKSDGHTVVDLVGVAEVVEANEVKVVIEGVHGRGQASLAVPDSSFFTMGTPGVSALPFRLVIKASGRGTISEPEVCGFYFRKLESREQYIRWNFQGNTTYS